MEFLRDSNHFLRHPVPSKLYFNAIDLSIQRCPSVKESGSLIRSLRDLLNKRTEFLGNEICSCEFCQNVYKILGRINGLDV